MKVNKHYKLVEDSYLFAGISRRVAAFSQENPQAKVIRLGIGDVTLPLCGAVTEALQKAVAEMGEKETFRGYGPEQGYDFLRGAIQADYHSRGVDLAMEEIFVSDGAKSDLGNILDLFDADNRVLVPDPVYPVYVDTNIMAGRKVAFLNANAQNGFLPLPEPGLKADIIYLCSPNNPTGAVYGSAGLKAWVDFALEHRAVILFDAAYESFVVEPGLPRSIYEIEGAKNCAIEFCSLSKTAGFTGLRCGYTVVPRALESEGMSLNKMWLRRQTTKFNGVSYVVQRAAEAAFSPEGRTQRAQAMEYYRHNAQTLAGMLDRLGIWYTGGKNSPYLWMRCPRGDASWDFFDRLLTQAQVVGTPGAGFGANGEGYFRLTAFGDQAATAEAARRMEDFLSGKPIGI